ncbi:hypothetical protein GJ744_004785 [Endocarpon pusillum]|uniref:INSIG domain protein n=1 Tax=Endocarpon pusillum TaxID=364733 RepID=A0A8H7A8J4_9EURO|nr:hypothetical protein GJ744_004785 [Endocarpon pusillum]
MSDTPQIQKPIPRRTFELTPASAESSVPPSPSPESTNPELLEARLRGASTPSRTRSLLNLTSSTLLGIYSRTGYEVSGEEPSTPWGTGAQTPNHRQSVDGQRPSAGPASWDKALPPAAFGHRKHGFRGLFLPLLLRVALLFMIGIAYGTLITHLHDNQKLAPVKVDAFSRRSRSYMTFWGLVGVALGSLQPWIDSMWSETAESNEGRGSPVRKRFSSSPANGDDNHERPGFSADWTPVVRSIGAFVGIAFAIRKLPWQSTLQVSLTLALVNPVLWYLIDKSITGFISSAVFGIAGTFVLLEINPDIVPSPNIQAGHIEGLDSFISQEIIGVWAWVASVLFCSCLCFGNIGRRLALNKQSAVN